MGFQHVVNITPAPAVAGDFASGNPRATVLIGPGGFVAAASGVVVGKFAWIEGDGVSVTNSGTYDSPPSSAPPAGFVHRDQQALITEYLGESTQVIPEGFAVTLFSAGDFWAKNQGAGATTIGGTVYASLVDGSIETTSAGVATNFTFQSVAQVGELAKISTWA